MKRGGHVSAGYLQPSFTQCGGELSSSRQEHRNVATNTSAATPLGTKTPPASHLTLALRGTLDTGYQDIYTEISRYKSETEWYIRCPDPAIVSGDEVIRV